MDYTNCLGFKIEQEHQDSKRRFNDNVELRDKFAMAALSGMCASNTQWQYPQEVSILAYETADAMLEARGE